MRGTLKTYTYETDTIFNLSITQSTVPCRLSNHNIWRTRKRGQPTNTSKNKRSIVKKMIIVRTQTAAGFELPHRKQVPCFSSSQWGYWSNTSFLYHRRSSSKKGNPLETYGFQVFMGGGTHLPVGYLSALLQLHTLKKVLSLFSSVNISSIICKTQSLTNCPSVFKQ